MHYGWAAKEFADLASRHQAATTALTYSGTIAVQSGADNNNSSGGSKDASDGAAAAASAGRAVPLRVNPALWGAVDLPPLDELGAPPDAEEQESIKALAQQIEAADASTNPGGAAASAAASGGGGDSDAGTGRTETYSAALANRLCFTDSDLRYRGAEERASEAIVENACRSAAEHINAARHRMTKPVRNLLLPLHPDVPAAFKLRLERDRVAASAATVLTQEPIPSSGELLAFDVVRCLTDSSMRTSAVSTDSMLSVPLVNALTAMRAFYTRRLKELPRIQLRVLQRFVAASYHAVELSDSKRHAALLRGAKNAFLLLANESDMVRSAALRIGVYHDKLVAMQRRKDASHATSEAGTQPENAMLSPVAPSLAADAASFEIDMAMRVVEELRVDDFRSYLHAKNTDVRLNRKIERFVAQCELLPLAKRFEMYTEAINASIDGSISGWRPHSTASLMAEDLLSDPAAAAQQMLLNSMMGVGGADGGGKDGAESASTGSGAAGAASVPSIQAFRALPALMADRHAVQRQLTELCHCFGVEPHVDGSDTHSFVFGVTRKASIVFQAQQRALSFLNERQLAAHIATLAAEADQASGGGGIGSAAAAAAAAASSSMQPAAGDPDNDFGFSKPRLRPATGASAAALLFDGDGADQPAWLAAQRAAIAAVAPRPHPAIEAELRFLGESNFQTVQNRWKERAANGAGMVQSMIAMLSGGGNNNNSNNNTAASGGGDNASFANGAAATAAAMAASRHKTAIRSAQQQQQQQQQQMGGMARIDSTTTQRLFCVFLLRFIRIREIRRRILATLNFFASIERRLAIDCQTVLGASGLKQTNVPLAGQAPGSAAVADMDPALFGDTAPQLDQALGGGGGSGASVAFDALLSQAALASEQTQRWFASGVGAAAGDPATTVPTAVPGLANGRGCIPLGSLHLAPDDPLAPPDAYVHPNSVGSHNSSAGGSGAGSGNVDDATREFTWTVIDGTCCPLRGPLSARTPVVFQAALLAQQQLEVEAVSIASYFVAQRAEAAFHKAHGAGSGDGGDNDDLRSQSDATFSEHAGSGSFAGGRGTAAAAEALLHQHNGGGGGGGSAQTGGGAANIDYLSLLEDVLECEGWFAEAKRDVVAALFTAYTHTTDVDTQSQLGRQLMEAMRRRPRIDLRDTNFAKSYSGEVVALEMQARLLKEVLDHQLQHFRNVVTELGLNVAVTVPPAAAQMSQARAATQQQAHGGSSSNNNDGAASAAGAGGGAGNVPRHAGPSRVGMPFVLPWNEATDGGPLPRFRPVPSATPTAAVFDIACNCGSLARVLPAAKAATKAMLGRFPDLDKDTAAQLQLEVTMWREMLDAWHVLDEEDRASRDMLQQRPGGAAADGGQTTQQSTSSSSASPVTQPQPLGVYWNLYDDPPTFDALMQEVGSSSPAFGGGKAGAGGAAAGGAAGGARKTGPAFDDDDDESSLRAAASNARRSGGRGGADGEVLMPSDVQPLPTPGPVVLAYTAAIEALKVRTELVAALHRTELLYNTHRRQATMMGITVRKQQLDAIDFEARRAFAEVDRPEQLQNRMDATGAGAPPTRGNVDEGERVVLAVGLPVELLPRLAIAEFDLAMARFDFASETGVRRLLTSQLGDLHRALSIQVATKNLAAAVVAVNNAPLDLYLENLARKRWEALALRVADSATFITAAGVGGAGGASHHLLSASPAEAAEFGLRKLHWPTLEHNDDPLEDRHTVQSLYVSLNTVKSTLRRAILADLNTHAAADSTSATVTKAASGALRIPAADLARRRAKLLKELLLEEYCSSAAVFCVKYGAVCDAVWHSNSIRWYAAQHPDVFHNVFRFGSMYDRVRQTPAALSATGASSSASIDPSASTAAPSAAASTIGGGASSIKPKGVKFSEGGDDQQNNKDATAGGDATGAAAAAAGGGGGGERISSMPVQFGGLLSRGGLVDDYRYIPHPVQLLVTDYDPQAAPSAVYTLSPPEPRHSGAKSQRHFIECAILTSQADLLAQYHALVKLARSHSVMALSQREALTVLHYACPAPDNGGGGATADELREQRRRNHRRYRVGAWNSLEQAWRAHMVVLQRDASYFVQQQCGAAQATTQDGFMEAAGLLGFLTTAHRVMFLKFNVLARGTLDELRSIDALNAAQESNAAAALVVASSNKKADQNGGGDNNNDKDAGGSSGGDAAEDGQSQQQQPQQSQQVQQHQSFIAANQRALTASRAQALELRSELVLLSNDMMRHREWAAVVDAFTTSEDFVNRSVVCRQSRTAHPMVLFLQQIHGGIRRVFVPMESRDSEGGGIGSRSGGGGGVAAKSQREGAFSRAAGGGNQGGGSNNAVADDGSTRFMALPPHIWAYNAEVGLAITRAVQAMVGVPATAITESAAHMHHLLDSLHISFMLTRFTRVGRSAGGDGCATSTERAPLYDATPSLAWQACSQRVRAIWRREEEKFEATASSAGSILDVFDPNRQTIGSGVASAGGAGGGEGFGDAAAGAAASAAAARDVTISAEQALQGKQRAYSRGSEYATALRVLIDTVRRDQLRDACMVLVRQEKMPAPGDPGAQRPAQQRHAQSPKLATTSMKYDLHHASGGGGNSNAKGGNSNISHRIGGAFHSAAGDVFSVSASAQQHQAQLMMSLSGVPMSTLHAISHEWTTRVMAKTRKWVERLDLLARETAMALSSQEPMPSFVPPYVVQPVPPLLMKLIAEATDEAMFGAPSAASQAASASASGTNIALAAGRLAASSEDAAAVANGGTGARSALPALGGAGVGGGTFSARDAHRRVVTGVMMAELHRMLLKRASRDLQSVVQVLEATTRIAEERSAAVAPESSDLRDRLAATMGTGLAGQDAGSEGSKGEIFADFASIILARSSVVRDEFGPGGSSNPVVTYQIPETALSLALSTAARRLTRWCHARNVATDLYYATLLGAQQRRISTLEGEVARLETQRELDQKMVTRRVQAAVSDQHFALMFELDHLSKETGALRTQLQSAAETVREAVTAEFEEKLSQLHQQLLVSQGQYRTFQRRLQEQLQNSLEGIKREAILNVTKMESAPLHMRRQAMKMAVVDSEMHSLKRENSVLRQTVLKAKLWFEVRLLRQRSDFEQRIHALEAAMQETRSTFWTNRELALQERDQLTADLKETMKALARAESEVDQLRRDLQTQVGSRRDMSQFKAAQAKLVAELQGKIRRLEQQRARLIAEAGIAAQTAAAAAAASGDGNSPAGLPPPPMQPQGDDRGVVSPTGDKSSAAAAGANFGASMNARRTARPPSTASSSGGGDNNRGATATPLGARRRLLQTSAGGGGGVDTSGAQQNQAATVVREDPAAQALIRQLKGQLERERAMKHQAMARAEQLQRERDEARVGGASATLGAAAGGSGSETTAALWQRKYVEASSQVQHLSSELARLRTVVNTMQHQQQQQSSSSAAAAAAASGGGSPLKMPFMESILIGAAPTRSA